MATSASLSPANGLSAEDERPQRQKSALVTRFRSVMRGRCFPAPARPAWICFRVIFVVVGRFQPIWPVDMVSGVPYPRWRHKVSFVSRAPSYRSWPLGGSCGQGPS